MTSRFPRLLPAAAVTLAAGLALGAALPAGAATSPSPTPTASASARAAATPTPSATVTPTPTPAASTRTPTPTPSASLPSPSATTTPTAGVPPVTPPVQTPTPAPTPTRTRILPIPTATRINGVAGHSAYSRTITMTGTGFADLAAVQVAGIAVPDLVVVSPTVARFTLPNAIDYQPKVAPLSLVSREDGLARPTPLTFTYRVMDKLDRQMAYAFQHWNVRSNRVFGYLSGNDCANFASQTLLARGWRLSTEWFNRGAGRWSATWVSSTAMSNWLWKRKDLVTHLDYAHKDQAAVGDIVQFRWAGHPEGYKSWDHTGIVSKVVVLPDGTHDVYYVSHTNDRQYGGSTQMFTKWMGKSLRMQFWHLKQ